MQTKKNYAQLRCRLAQVLLCLGLAFTLWSAPPADRAVNPPPNTKSEFVDNPKFGKDPFFPNSQRRVANNEPVVADAPLVQARLKLQGISGPLEKRLAIINNRTFETGEEAEMKLDGKLVKVRCVEIKERSVIMMLNNQPQELTLGSRF